MRPYSVLFLACAVIACFAQAQESEPAAAAAAPAEPVVVESAAEPPAAEAVIPKELKAPKLWTGQFDLGLNGATGNSKFFNIRSLWAGTRENEQSILKASALYNRNTTGSLLTQNQLFLDSRYDYKLANPKWKLYVFGQAWYDTLQDWDWRLVTGSGVAYYFIKNDKTTFEGRVGPGVSREIGGPRNDFVPELNMGLGLNHKFNDRVSLTASTDYYPSVKEFSDYRLNSALTVDAVIDPVRNISLRTGLLSRYQSRPGAGREQNDLNYFTAIVWKY